MKQENKYMTVKDYADKFGITVQTVYNKIKNKELETKKMLVLRSIRDFHSALVGSHTNITNKERCCT